MVLQKRVIHIILSVILFIVIGNLYSNGINPPRPSGSIVLKAKIKNKKDDVENIIYRARIIVGRNKTDSLAFILNGSTKLISIKDIRKIKFNSNNSDSLGFLIGSLVLNDETEENNIKILTKIDNKPIHLEGFIKERNRKISIDFAKCKTIEFSSEIPPMDTEYEGDAECF